MDIWPPPPQRTEQDTAENIQPPKTLVAVALGILAGLLGGVLISVAVWLIKSVFDRQSVSLKLPGYFYFLAVLIEIGLGRVLFPKNKAFAIASVITAAYVSTVLAVTFAIINGFSEFD